MPSQEVNALLLRAVGDEELRTALLENPKKAAADAGLSPESQETLARIRPSVLQAQFSKLTSITADLGGALEAGHSRDWADENIHNKDDHIHNKNFSILDPSSAVTQPAIDATTLEAALQDPVVRREFQNNDRLRTMARNVLGRDI